MNKSNIFIRGLLKIKFKNYPDNYLETRIVLPNKIRLTFNGICNDSEILSHPSFESVEQVKDKSYVIFNATKWIYDIDKFLNGKYREMSTEAKNNIISCFSPGKNLILTLSIFYPKQQDIDILSDFLDYKLPENADIYSKPKEEEEVYYE